MGRTRGQCEREDISLAAYYFHQGTNYHAYECLGVHCMDQDAHTYVFRVWAPGARAVSLISDFSGWDEGVLMERVTEGGIWETFWDGDVVGKCYKYRITCADGHILDKADPYAMQSETLQKTASIVPCTETFVWKDQTWMQQRRQQTENNIKYFYPHPMYIYELHLGSFLTRNGVSPRKNSAAYLNYREIARELIPYLKQLGCTHVQLLPVAEHPTSSLWGYEVTGFYAPTGRFGAPNDFRYFVNALHENGIGVILDWVPSHFPNVAHGLARFDGTPLYECQGADRQVFNADGALAFDVARNEVQCFLVSNALYWMREFHVDGLRIGSVSEMLYLDSGKQSGEWIPNVHGDNRNLESIAFFQKLSAVLFSEFPDALLIAEQTSAFPMLTTPVAMGGLGFNFQWDTMWAQEMFSCVSADHELRVKTQDGLSHMIQGAFCENAILPVAHHAVVHGKKSLIDKQYGDWRQKFAGARLFFAYQMACPGKKLLFMGSEYGQFREWDATNQLEWFMLEHETHRKLHTYFAELGQFYRSHGALWEIDFDAEGFLPLPAQSRDGQIAFWRKNRKGSMLLCLFNFSAEKRAVRIPISEDVQSLEVVWNSDAIAWGGSGTSLGETVVQNAEICELTLEIPPLSAVYLKPKRAKKASEKTMDTHGLKQ